MRKSTYQIGAAVLFSILTFASAECQAQDAQPPLQVPSIASDASAVSAVDLPAQTGQAGSCAMRVYTAQFVAGVTTKSGFAKFALGTLLPAVAGSAAGSAAGPGGFQASRDLAAQSSIAANRATANKASDVPQAIASEFTQAGQADAIRALMSRQAGSLASAPAVIDEGQVPTNGLDAAPFGLTEIRCVRVLTINSITFEHSKDFKARNAIVILSNLTEYSGGKKKPSIRVYGESRTPITPFAVDQEIGSPELKAELNKAFYGAITELVEKFEKKGK
ncbi:MAG: hypothetical protein AABY88_04380 [Pseudomonadota bacterium]